MTVTMIATKTRGGRVGRTTAVLGRLTVSR
jgi:hypothetical protein